MKLLATRPFLSAEPHECDAEGCDGGLVLGEDGAAVPCTCHGDRVSAVLFSHSRLPVGLLAALRAPAEPPECLDAMARSAYRGMKSGIAGLIERTRAGAGGLISIIGAAGSGKTWALAQTARFACTLGVGVAYVDVSDPFQAVSDFGNGDEQRGRRMLLGVPLLLVDNLGEHRNRTASLLARDIVQGREAQGMSTIVTTRLSSKRFAGEFGESLADMVRASRHALTHGSLRGAS